MDNNTNIIEDNMSGRSGSVGCRSPPSLSPVVSVQTSGSPNSPPPLLLAPQLHPPPHTLMRPITPPMFPATPPMNARQPPFLHALYFPHAYASPPPIMTSDPTANECKLIDYRGHKVACFTILGDNLLCLPQAFEIFLKNLVGGLHTVYTKLKRLGIEPMVCNVEQVRVLRGLGAIQPGVNRCKLLSVKHFDLLYKDCTTARPGRPPKRPHDILGLGYHGHPHSMGTLPSHPLSAEALMALKKSRMEGRDFHPFLNGNMHNDSDLEKSPLLSNGYNPPPKALMAQYMALNGGLPPQAFFPPSGLPIAPPPPGSSWPPPPQDFSFKGTNASQQEAFARSMGLENCRVSYDDVIKHLERIREDRARSERDMGFPEREEPIEPAMSPLKNNVMKLGYRLYTAGYNSDASALNLSSKTCGSDSLINRDDMSDSGHAEANDSPSHDTYKDDNDDPLLSDNDDYDDKNDLSDRDDFDFQPTRSLHNDHSSLTTIETLNAINAINTVANSNNNNHTTNGLVTISKNLVDSLNRTHHQQHGGITLPPVPHGIGGLPHGDGQLPAGLNLGNSLMSLGMGLASGLPANHGSGLTNSTPSENIPNNTLLERRNSDPTIGSLGASFRSPSSSPAVGATSPAPHQPLSSLEELLGNIQNLLKVAAESVRHEEKRWFSEKEQLRVEFMRQKELRERLERQLDEDEKLKMIYLRKLKREKRVRRKLEDQLTDKSKKLQHYEPLQPNNNNKEMLSIRTTEKPPIYFNKPMMFNCSV